MNQQSIFDLYDVTVLPIVETPTYRRTIMRITIQANGFTMTHALRAYTEQRLASALGWARTRMQRLVVQLSDINGPRGGVDKRCKIQVQLGGGRAVVIEDTEAD